MMIELHPESLTGVAQEDIERQERQEHQTMEDAALVYRRNYQDVKRAKGDLTQFSPEAWLTQQCIEKTAQALKVNLAKKLYSGRGSEVRNVVGFLQAMDPYILAFITSRIVLNMPEEREAIQSLCIRIGSAIKEEAQYQLFKEAFPGYVHTIKKNFKSANTRYRQTVLTHTRLKQGIGNLKWSEDIRFHIGKILLNQLVVASGCFELFKYRSSNTRNIMQGVRLIPEAKVQISLAHDRCAYLAPSNLPMLIPPMKWSSPHNGGFIMNHVLKNFPVIRNLKPSDYKEDHGLETVYQALNAIQGTPFKINKRVLEVMEEYHGTGIATMPIMDLDRLLDAVPCPWSTDKELEKMKLSDPERVMDIKRKRAGIYSDYYRSQSKRTVIQKQMRIANDFKDKKEFYYCYCIDWRGRIYPLQTHLHPQADDKGKALLLFSKGVALGPKGADWLAVHGANCYGVDRVSHQDRIQWVLNHEKEILLSAEHPLDYNFWSATDDDPWLFLAFCLEWKQYVDQGRSKDFISYIPVQMDGACNGLQHFSALLRDTVGAKAVCLEPMDIPADIYGEVAKESIRLIKKDCSRHPKTDKDREIRTMAQAWDGKVDRSFAKKNTMTFVYGSSIFGFTEQNVSTLQKYKEKHKEELLGGIDHYLGAGYLSKINREAIHRVVHKPSEAMQFMQKFAQYVSSLGHDIEWTTPTGMKVKQKYRKYKRVRFDTYWGEQRIRVQCSLVKPTDRIDTRRMGNGIAPNFIHSLDASHLAKTALKMQEEGIQNSSFIHDSFGTSAGELEKMNQILRKVFIDMYSGDLLKEWYDKIMGELTPDEQAGWGGGPPVSQGDFDVTQVERSPYFFS